MGFVKTCTKCGKTKPIDDFYNSPTGKYGVYSVCKECQRKEHKKYYAADLERRREMNRKYRERHQEKERLAKEKNESCYNVLYKDSDTFELIKNQYEFTINQRAMFYKKYKEYFDGTE